MIKVIFFVIFSLTVSHISANIVRGKCANVNMLKNFQVGDYSGKWYEINRFDVIFERSLKCVTAEYGPINDTHVTVRNGGINM